MKTEAIIKRVSEIPAGRFFRVRYITKVKVKAEYEKQGISIFKIVDTTTRTGVKYKNISGVKLNDYPDEYEPKKTNWEWVVKDRIKHNTKTGKDYIVIAPIGKGSNTRVEYVLSDNEGSAVRTKEEIESYVIPSYWKDGEKPAVMNVTLENVLLVK
jgi:hypothetical protein